MSDYDLVMLTFNINKEGGWYCQCIDEWNGLSDKWMDSYDEWSPHLVGRFTNALIQLSCTISEDRRQCKENANFLFKYVERMHLVCSHPSSHRMHTHPDSVHRKPTDKWIWWMNLTHRLLDSFRNWIQMRYLHSPKPRRDFAN